jgi:hypothetical protein
MSHTYTVNYYDCLGMKKGPHGQWQWRKIQAFTPGEAERECRRILQSEGISFYMIGVEE